MERLLLVTRWTREIWTVQVILEIDIIELVRVENLHLVVTAFLELELTLNHLVDAHQRICIELLISLIKSYKDHTRTVLNAKSV